MNFVRLMVAVENASKRLVVVLPICLISACAVDPITTTQTSTPTSNSELFEQRVQVRIARQHLRGVNIDRSSAEDEAVQDMRYAARAGLKRARTESSAKERERAIWGETSNRDFTRYEAARQEWQLGVQSSSDMTKLGARKTAGVSPELWRQLKLTQHPSGRVNHLWVNPSNASRLIAGTDGDGLWKSDDAGATWVSTTNSFGAMAIEKIAFSLAAPQVLYAATGSRRGHSRTLGKGLLKSTDGGETWSTLSATSPNCSSITDCARKQDHWQIINGIDVSPASPSVVVVATSLGLWRTADAGLSWFNVLPAPTSVYAAYRVQFADIQFNPMDASKALAVTDEGTAYRSGDGGTTWTAFTVAALPKSQGARIHYSRAVNGRIYLLGGNASSYLEVHRSNDNGASWGLLASVRSPSGSPAFSSLWYTGALWVDPTDENMIVAGSGWPYRSQNGGSTWESFCCGWADPTSIVSDPGYNGTSNKRIYLADDGGVYRYNDISASQSSSAAGSYATVSYLNTGLSVTQNNVVAGASPGPVITGNQDVGIQSYQLTTSPATSWRLSQAGDGTDVAVDATNPSTIYATTQYAAHIYRSDDGGATQTVLCSTWTAAAPPAAGTAPCVDNAPFSARFALDPQSPKRMYFGGKSLWRSDDVKTAANPAWTKIYSALSSDYGVRSITVSRVNADHLWFIQDSPNGARILRSTNASSAAPVFMEASAMPQNCWANVIHADSADTDVAWLGCAGFLSVSGLYKTIDAGATWRPVSSFPVMPIYAISQHPANSSHAYVGTEFGLYASDNSGASWSPSSEGPGNIAVTSIAWYAPTTMLIGTYGRNVWLTTVKQTKTMTEFHYPALDYYFATSRDSDKAALDAIAGWTRTGKSFTVLASGDVGAKGITRYYFDQIARGGARGSHFYTLVDSENVALTALNPTNAQLPSLPFNEGIDSYAYPPAVEGVGGSCASGLVPVFRAFRGQARFPDDPNHRFTIDVLAYNGLVAKGWDGEGVKFCVPST